MRLHLPREHPEIGPSGREVNHVFRILLKKPLGENVTLFEIEAPRVARRHRAGQFVMVRPHANSERIPLTIADVDRATGTITLVVQAVGKTTIEMTEAFARRATPSRTSPARSATRRTSACPASPRTSGARSPASRAESAPRRCSRSRGPSARPGHEVVTILGARRQDLLVFEDRLGAASTELLVCTDDGSYGRKGFVTDVLKDADRVPAGRAASDVDLAIAIGPPLMMKFCSKTTEPYARADARQPEHDHGRRHRDVRRLPRHGGRRRASTSAWTVPSSTATASTSTG